MAEFRRERVLFHVMAQGSIEVDIEVGAETAEQAFRRVFTPANYAHSALVMLVNETDDLDWVITCATEPKQECQHVYVFGSSVCSLCGDVLTIPCVENYVPKQGLVIEKNIIAGGIDANAPYKVMVGATPYFFYTLTDAQEFIAGEQGAGSERSGDNTTDPSIDPDGQTSPEVTVVRDRRVVNTPHRHPGPADTGGSDREERREQFQAEQEELGRSIDQMLRGGER